MIIKIGGVELAPRTPSKPTITKKEEENLLKEFSKNKYFRKKVLVKLAEAGFKVAKLYGGYKLLESYVDYVLPIFERVYEILQYLSLENEAVAGSVVSILLMAYFEYKDGRNRNGKKN